MAQAEYDQLARALPHDQYLVQCGRYQSARNTVDLVDTLISKAEEHDGRTRAADDHERAHAQSITYGTPFWRSGS